MSFANTDQDNRVVAVVLIAILLMAIGVVLGVGVYRARSAASETPVARAEPAAVAAAVEAASGQGTVPAPPVATGDDSSILVENGVVKFYFALGKAELAPGAAEALTDAIAAGKAGRRLVLSGYHDATGDPAKNAELAKRRALAVRDALLAAGVDASVIELRKPEETTGSGHAAEARRVEVEIAD
jgi:outer membrane protein OmpA-like peptidoglycan-associated protein